MKKQILSLVVSVFILSTFGCVENSQPVVNAESNPQVDLPSSEVREINGIQHIDGVLRFSDAFNALQFKPDAHTFSDLDSYYKTHLASNIPMPENATKADLMAVDNMRGSFLSLAITSYDFPNGLSEKQKVYYSRELAEWNVLIEPEGYRDLLTIVRSEQLLSDSDVSALANKANEKNIAFYSANSEVAESMKTKSGWHDNYFAQLVQSN